MNYLPSSTLRRVFALSALLLVSGFISLHAASVSWTGGNAGVMTVGTNWNPNTDFTTDTNSDLTFATANNVTTTILVGNNTVTGLSVRSISLDDTAAMFHNATVGLRIAATNSGTNTTARSITFVSAGVDLLSLTNNAALTLTPTTVNGTGVPILNLVLDYSGTSTLRVDATSKLSVTANATSGAYAAFSGTGGLIKDGAGSIVLNGNSTFSGGFTLLSGQVSITGSGAAAGNAITTSAFGQGTLVLNGGSIISSSDTSRSIYNSVNLDGSVSLSSTTSGSLGAISVSTSGGGTTTLLGNSTLNVVGTATWNQAISGNATLTKTGAGNLALNGTNTFTGLNLNAGTVTADAPTALGSSADFNAASIVFDGGTLAFTAGNNSSFSANRGIQIGSGNATIDLSSGRNIEIAGPIADVSGQHGMLTKTGSGTLTLSGANSYTGSTTVQGGALVGDSTSLQGAIVLNNASSITFNQTADGTYAGSLNGNGSFSKLGSANLIVSNQSSHTGLNTVLEGNLVLQDAIFGGAASAGLNVAWGAGLGGSGIIRGNAVFEQGSRLSADTYQGGIISNALGKISFNNDLDLSGLAAFDQSPVTIVSIFGAPLAFDLGTANFSDQIVVYGTLDIGSGLLDLQDFSFTSAASLHDGTFTLFSAPNHAIVGSLGTELSRYFGDGFTGTLSLTSNEIQLTLVGAPIPEPATCAVLLGGVAALAALYRRRRAAR